ncbi:efflux RND transporter periplasmic adaptor subunit, partial [Pseudoduganella eburnea]|nr:efflux RND transporter periplasmic adaptor subunit [Massilia eburnea]
PDQTAKVMNIKRLHGFGALVAVSGLNGDEKIVVEGKQNLRPGAKLRIAEPAVADNGKSHKKGKAE